MAKSMIISNRLIGSLVIASLLIGIYVIEETKGNFSPGPLDIRINSPQRNSYTSNQTLLNITISTYADSLNGSDHRWIAYSLDGQENKSITPNYQGISWSSGFPFSKVTAQALLNDLSEGAHTITVFAKYYYNNWVNQGSSETKFTVGISPEPALTINVPYENQVFKEISVIPYSVNVSVSPSAFKDNKNYGYLFSIAYSIDNKKPVEIASDVSIDKPHLIYTGNLQNLENGNHTIRLYASWASDGERIALHSNDTYFSIDNKLTDSSNLFSFNLSLTLIVSIIIAILLVAILSFLVYRHRKITQNKQNTQAKA
jgi:hypothetical protein